MSAQVKNYLLILSAIFFLSACGNSLTKENTTNLNVEIPNKSANQNSANTSPIIDVAEKTKIEDALKKEGFKDLTIDYSTQPPTLRGKVSQDKIAIAILVAEKAADKKLMNGLSEK